MVRVIRYVSTSTIHAIIIDLNGGSKKGCSLLTVFTYRISDVHKFSSSPHREIPKDLRQNSLFSFSVVYRKAGQCSFLLKLNKNIAVFFYYHRSDNMLLHDKSRWFFFFFFFNDISIILAYVATSQFMNWLAAPRSLSKYFHQLSSSKDLRLPFFPKDRRQLTLHQICISGARKSYPYRVTSSSQSSASMRCLWCNCYRRRNWTRRLEFKSWTRLIAFHIALIPLGKV